MSLFAASIAAEAEAEDREETAAEEEEGKAAAIVSQLRVALDLEVGGDFARKLFGLYGYIGDHLIQGNIRKEPEPLREAQRHLKVIQEAWREMLAAQTTGSVIASAATRPASASGTERINFNMSV
jgi:flagellar protein FliS